MSTVAEGQGVAVVDVPDRERGRMSVIGSILKCAPKTPLVGVADSGGAL
jgi:hypothetical protein